MLDSLRVLAAVQLFVPDDATDVHVVLYFGTFGVTGVLVVRKCL